MNNNKEIKLELCKTHQEWLAFEYELNKNKKPEDRDTKIRITSYNGYNHSQVEEDTSPINI